jgi:PAS domain S-box-containing protein
MLNLFWSGQVRGGNSDFLIQSWQDHEGLPESSALAVAQTPDGYLWIGSPEGLLRFNGVSFTRAEKFPHLIRLTTGVPFLQTDHSGRLWAGTESGLACYRQGVWQGIKGTNFSPRSVADDVGGRVLIGGTEGQLYTVLDGNLEKLSPPDGVKPSGVFCLTDAKDGQLWLANRGFIGRMTSAGWKRFGPANPMPKPLLAAPARNGGVWIFTPGELWHYHADGSLENFPAPDLDQPRVMIEDQSGMIWIASIASGLTRFRPGGEISRINATNGLAHNAVRCLIEDREGNVWAGGSLNGLNRLRLRQFFTIGRAEGLPDNIVRTVAEISPGEIIVGTHGGGTARIHDGKVEPQNPPSADAVGQYVWTLLQDRAGRLWVGTFSDGLFVEENGVRRQFPLPAALGKSITRLMEDSRGRIWLGGPNGLGLIENNLVATCFTNSVVAGYAITSLAEDAKSGVIWIGTYAHGVLKMDAENLAHVTKLAGLPGERTSSLTLDNDGYLWVGVFEHGLACFHDGQTTLIGAEQGLPADTIGSVLDDGRGSFWLGTTHGILRVARDELHRVAREPSPPAVFNLFNVSDGLGSEYCAEGYQPNALRDSTGRLWFGTDRGVVTINPAQLRLNTNPPPVVIERVGFTDLAGTNHISFAPSADKLVIPAGSVELEFYFDGLSYAAPEKVTFKYLLAGVNQNWRELGHHRELHFHQLAPGDYVLRLKAANNDGVWNEDATAFAFTIEPFVWQRLWFRLLVLVAVAGGGGLVVWRVSNRNFQRRIAERKHAEAEVQRREKYFRSLIEHASDSITVINPKATVTFQSSSGERILGYPAETMLGRCLFDLVHPEDLPKAKTALAQSLTQLNTPVTLTARLRHRDGSWRTIEAVGTGIQTETDERQVILNSRDLTDNLKLEEQFRQAQKMEAVGTLAGGIAHDFNNILAAIFGYGHLLQQDTEGNPAAQEDVAEILKAASRAKDLVQQILTFSRQREQNREIIRLDIIVKEATKFLRASLPATIEIELQRAPDTPAILGDPTQIYQVIINLATNALHAMEGRPGQLTVKLNSFLPDEKFIQAHPEFRPVQYSRLTVADTGHGMDAKTMERIFEPFFTTKPVGKGTGLGLAVVHGIVRSHDGIITVESQPGQGATFCVFFPAKEADAISGNAATVTLTSGHGENILLVDDESALTATLQRMLTRLNYQVTATNRASVALRLFRDTPEQFDLVITDLAMPEMNGLEVARRLREIRADLPVILVSGHAPDLTNENLREAGIAELLKKPVFMPTLAAAVQRMFDAPV